jgi:hypothetical protein
VARDLRLDAGYAAGRAVVPEIRAAMQRVLGVAATR